MTFITRLRLDAALYKLAPPRRPGQIGRPRIKGERLPNLSVVAVEANTVWKPIKIANWYGSAERMVEIVSKTAVWYSTGLFTVPLRWVLVRDSGSGIIATFGFTAQLLPNAKQNPTTVATPASWPPRSKAKGISELVSMARSPPAARAAIRSPFTALPRPDAR